MQPSTMQGTHAIHSGMDAQPMQDCIRNCEECHMTCMRTVQYCLTMGGRHVDPNHMVMMLDCADLCRTTADLMLRNSPRHAMVCGVCSQVCDQCAADCERIANGDQTMLSCAASCRRCADSCRMMNAVAM